MIEPRSSYGLRHAVPAIVNTLKAAENVTALVNTENIYPLIKTTDFPLPSISVAKVGWTCKRCKSGIQPDLTRREDIVSETLTVQINIFTKAYDLSAQIAEEVVKALDGKSVTYDSFKLDSITLQSCNEDVIGADIAVFQQTLTFSVDC